MTFQVAKPAILLLLLSWSMLVPRGALAADAETRPEHDPLVYTGPAQAADEVWLVNTREIKKASVQDPGLSLRRSTATAGWKEATIEPLAAKPDDALRTVIYVHGYDFDADKAERVGWAMYHRLREQLPAAQRLRFVVWSWPATSLKYRYLRDLRDKARRTKLEAFFLAWMLSRVDVDAVIGSALGCRAVTGALHLLAGDAPSLNTVVTADARRQKLRVVLISPAIDDDWLLPGAYHGKALSQVSHLLSVNNLADPTLANYAAIATKQNAAAMGLSGLATPNKLGEAASRLDQVDVSELISKHHGVENYLRSAAIVERLASFIFGPLPAN